MPRKPVVLLLSSFIIGSSGHAQTGKVVPPPTVDQGVTPQSMDVGTPEQMGDADPLDVLEPKKETTPVEPTVPQFTEIPDPNAKPAATPTPAPDLKTEPAPEIAAPAATPAPEAAPTPSKKKSSKVARKNKKKSATPAVVNNDPDLHREERFHNIYKKYNEQPTSEEAWDKASGARKAEVYKVQKGDTLWALSNTFFADTNYWPKIWSLNVGKISNPHEIDPSMNIQFFPGTMSDAPTLGVVDKTAGEKIAATDTATEMKEAPRVASNGDAIPLPKRKRPPVLNKIPSSIPAYHYEPEKPVTTLMDFPSLEKRFVSGHENLSYYIANGSPVSVGQISETELGMETATEFQYVIVKLNTAASAGTRFVVLREMEKVTDPDSSRSAHLIEVQGQIEIVERVHDSKDLYRALVRKSLQPLNVGAQVVAGSIPTFDPNATSLVSGPAAKIVGGEYDGSGRQQYQSNMIVFLNAGRAQGLQDGQSLPVYSDIRHRNPDSSAKINDRQVGTVKIIRVAESFATAYVTGAQDDIFIGDHVGGRNSGHASSLDLENSLDNNTEVGKAPPSDLISPTETTAPSSGPTENSDFELE